MEFHKIVITGGPCGGKTTGLSYIEQGLTQYGYKVVLLNESATELINSGLNYKSFENNYLFEKNIINLQLEKERVYEEGCRNLPNEKVLLICDRGIMDCKSYTSQEDFDRILRDLNTSEVELRDQYDAVFHLVTAAKGAEEYYTIANNIARRETVEEAIEADNRTMNCWVGHPHFRAIDNSTSFDLKLKRLLREITTYLGAPEPFEIERKYLIKKPSLEFLETLPNCKKIEIVQTYLISNNKTEEVRVRQRGYEGDYIYTKTVKKKISAIKRLETESRISEREYLMALGKADTKLHQITKTRYCIMHNNHYFEIDIYPFSNDYAICEIELSSEEERFDLPDYIKVIKEVTGDNTYTNKMLAKTRSLAPKKEKKASSATQLTIDTFDMLSKESADNINEKTKSLDISVEIIKSNNQSETKINKIETKKKSAIKKRRR